VDVPSRFARCSANPRLSPVEVWDPPRPELLQHEALVVEPRGAAPVWVFEGGRFLPYGLVPAEYEGATAMLLGRTNGEMRIVPEGPLENDASDHAVAMRLEADGSAKLKGSTVVRSAGAYRLKEQVLTAQRAQLRTFVEEQLNHTYRGVRLDEFDFPEVGKAGVPFRMTYEATVPGHVQTRNDRPTVDLGISPLMLTKKFGGKAHREQPFMLRLHDLQSDEIEIDLGGQYEVEAAPANLLLKERFGVYSLVVRVEAGKVRVTRTFALEPTRVEAADYGTVLRFCRDVDSAERKWIDLRPMRK
jgi:hypothetical protein